MKVPVSVVIPAYNSARFIRRTIESVQAQSAVVDEIIVVDNNCTDNTAQIALEMGATIAAQPKPGPAAARNAGIALAKNGWIALLDADDVWLKNKIRDQWKALKKFPAARIVGCEYTFLNSYNNVDEVLPKYKSPRRSAKQGNSPVVNGKLFRYIEKVDENSIAQFRPNDSTALIHREVFERVGVFDESLELREDTEFFMRALSFAPVVFVRRLLVHIRIHPFNIGQDVKKLHERHNDVIRRMQRLPDNYAVGAVEHNRQWLMEDFLRLNRIILQQAAFYRENQNASAADLAKYLGDAAENIDLRKVN
jgi:glycosyltransferase involved in cell wall biosynthesis